jgi:hypothetical protein
MAPAIQVLGAYALDVDPQTVDRALDLKYGGFQLSGAEAEKARRNVVEELSGVVLIELLVHDRDERFHVGDFGQIGSDQVAYDEAFLAADGTSVLSRGSDVPAAEPLRVAFFLHYYDPRQLLNTTYGPVELPSLKSMPPRLRELLPYEPVD